MRRFFVKGTDILVRESNRKYVCAVAYVREDASMVVYSCHTSFDFAKKEISRLRVDYSRHPMDFNIDYNPSKLVVVELESSGEW